jgi:phosphoglycerate dehydrogenase-like enzyme
VSPDHAAGAADAADAHGTQGRRGPHVLVSAEAWVEFGALVAAAAPGATFTTIDATGSLAATSAGAEPCAVPEVAWLSNDVFRNGVLAPLSALLQACPSVRWVQSGAAGSDGALPRALLARGVRFSTAHVTAVPIAEYVLGAVLRLRQQPERWAEAQQRREWRHREFPEVHGTTWLVVGVGAIGTEVAQRARAFGARVVGVRRTPRGDEPVDAMVRPDGILAAVPAAHVVVLCAPGTDATRHLVDATFLAAMRDDAVLVNVARGSLVDEAALLAALDAGRPAHAVLDVVDTEPLPADSPLWAHPRVTLTPHSSGGGLGRYARSAEVFAANLARYVAGEPIAHEVDRPEGAATWVTEVAP